MINILYVTPRSVTFEIDDGGYYNTRNKYRLSLKPVCVNEDGQCIDGDVNKGIIEAEDNRSVVSVFNLTPDTCYRVRVEFTGVSEYLETEFTTHYESFSLNVKDFGASGDGTGDDTSFIQAAVMCCPEHGRVLIPEGVYPITGIYLKSSMQLEIAKGAKLVFTGERERIPRFPAVLEGAQDRKDYFLGTWEGVPQPMFNGVISGINVKDCTVYGEGTVDGGATKEDWWFEPKVMRVAYRPRLVFLKGCTNVALQGLLLTNSPSWTVHPFYSNQTGFYNVTIKNPWDSPNTDGINPESCDGVEIAGVHFSLGDDCIAVKSGKIEMGRRYKTPSKNIHIFRCLMEDGHGAVTVGSEAAAGVRELVVEHCSFMRTDRGLRVKTRRGRGEDSIMDDIIFRDIEMDGVVTPFVVNSFYFCDTDGKTDYVQNREPLPVDERTPVIKRLVFERIHCINSHYAAGWFEGLPEKPIEEIVLHDIYVSFAENAGRGIPAMALNVPECSREDFVIKNVAKVDMVNVTVDR